MDMNYVFRRCPIHNHFIPQVLHSPTAPAPPVQTNQLLRTTWSTQNLQHLERATTLEASLSQMFMSSRVQPSFCEQYHQSTFCVPNLCNPPVIAQLPSNVSPRPIFASGFPFTHPIQFPATTRPDTTTMLDHSPLTSAPITQHQHQAHNPSSPPQTGTLCDHHSGFKNVEMLPHSKTKPPYSFQALIAFAITAAPHEMSTLTEIYKYISATFPYYKRSDKVWKRLIRQCLQNSVCFMKARNIPLELKQSRNYFWVINPTHRHKVLKGSFKRSTYQRLGQTNKSRHPLANDRELKLIPSKNTSITEIVPSLTPPTKRSTVTIVGYEYN